MFFLLHLDMMKNCSLKCQDEELLKQDSEVEYSWKWLFDENSDEQADEFDQFKENDDDPVTITDEDLFGKLLTKLFITMSIFVLSVQEKSVICL